MTPVQVYVLENGLKVSALIKEWQRSGVLSVFPDEIVLRELSPETFRMDDMQKRLESAVLLLASENLRAEKWLDQLESIQSLGSLLLVVKQNDYDLAVERAGWQRVMAFKSMSPEVLMRSIAYLLEIQALQKDMDELRSSGQSRSNFLASMSHEIRTPMNGIMGMVTLLLESELSAEQNEYLETIRESGETLLTLINDILDFSRIEAGQIVFDKQPVDVQSLVEAALDLLAVKAAENQNDLTLSLDPSVPVRILAAEVRLRQILVNLIGNAVKFTEQGEVHVAVKSRKLDENQHEITFSVKDSGIGIAPDKMAHLFLPYSQLDAGIHTRYGGTGLGLAISKRLIEMMGGKIWVESSGVPGEGSTFSFTLPVEEDGNSIIKLERQSFQPLFNKKCVLLLSNKKYQIESLTHILKFWGMQTVQVNCFEDAETHLVDGRHFDAALLDQNLLFAGQPDCLCGMLPDFETLKIPVILLKMPGDKREILSNGDPIYYLNKPVKTVLLYDLLRSLFSGSSFTNKKPVTAPFAIQPGELFPLRILLAEDNIINQKVVTSYLKRLGYQAEIVENGVEVINALMRQRFDVILMDMLMPEMDGSEATRIIREEFPTEKQPYIIALTANTCDADVNRYSSMRFDDYISKPFQISRLKRALQQAVQKNRESRVLESESGSSALLDDVAIDRSALRLFWSGLGEDTSKMQSELINMFLKSSPERLKKMFQLLKTNDAETIYHLSHTLKGEGKTFGAIRFAELCRQMEAMAKEHDLSRAPAVFTQIENEYDRVAMELEQILLDISK